MLGRGLAEGQSAPGFELPSAARRGPGSTTASAGAIRDLGGRGARQRPGLDPSPLGHEDGRHAAVACPTLSLVIDAAAADRLTPWRVRGSYFESCNCEAICPCRMISGRKGGRSTYGICFGVLSWLVEEGHAGDVGLDGLAAAFEVRYDDDEPGSPWSMVVHVDERGSTEQRQALAAILLGDLGGDAVLRLPWVSKPSELIDVIASPIEIENSASGHELRVGRAVTLAATRPFETNDVVACGIPGYDNPGIELLADELIVDDAPFSWELSGNCAFASAFDYSS
jgi:hypothetical protein